MRRSVSLHRLFSALLAIAAMFSAQSSPPLSAAEPCAGLWRLFEPGSGLQIVAIVTHDDGRVFVGSIGHGLRVYAPDTNGVYHWIVLPPATTDIRALAILGNELWVGTYGSGIRRMNLSDGTWVASSLSLPSNRVTALANRPGSSREMWIGTIAGTVRYTRIGIVGGGVREELARVLGQTDSAVRAIAAYDSPYNAPAGRYVWISTTRDLYRLTGNSMLATEMTFTGECRINTADDMVADRRRGLWFAGLEELPDRGYVPVPPCRHVAGRFISTWDRYADLTFLANHRVAKMAVDPAGRVWFAANGAIGMKEMAAVDLKEEDTYCVLRSNTHPRFASNFTGVDAVGETVWFGQSNGRILVYSPSWHLYQPNAFGALLGIPTVVLDEGDAVWAGIDRGISFSQDAGETWQHRQIDANPGLVTALARDGAGVLWIGTEASGLFTYHGGLSFTQHLEGLPSGEVRDLTVDPRGRLWVAAAGGVAMRANGYWLPFTAETSALDSGDITAIAADTSYRVWIATADRGVYSYDTIGRGDTAWRHEDTSNGLPSNAVNDLAVGGDGEVWIATDAGAASRDATGVWNPWNVASGALPGDEALSVAVDPKSGVWVGTNAGLAVRRVDIWEHLHASGTALSTDRVTHLTATEARLWATTADHRLARRDVLRGPIGVRVPEIDSFSPTQGPPGSVVTIRGRYFDDMVPEHNKVTIGDRAAGTNSFPPEAQIVSATASQLIIRVPENAMSGRIRVISHNLPGASTTDFLVGPEITGLNNTCVALGDKLVITGSGFFGGDNGWADVRIGNGPWNDLTASAPMLDRQTPGSITYRIRQTDTTGLVQVRNTDGLVAVSSQVVSVGSLELAGWRIQQGIQGVQMIWGKRTLIHLEFSSVGCGTHVTSGLLYWKHRNGSETLAGDASLPSPGGLSIPLYKADDPTITYDQGLDFEARFWADALSEPFPLSEFNGLRGVVKNGQAVLLEFDIPRSHFNFIDPGVRFHFIYMPVLAGDNLNLPCNNPGYDCRDFWKLAYQGMEHVARILPQQDSSWRNGPDRWIKPAGAHTTWPRFIDLKTDDYDDVQSRVDDFIDPEFWELGIALVDLRLKVGKFSGKAPVGGFGDTGVVFNTGRTGATWAHEAGHMLYLVDDDAPNYDDDNPQSGHSRYDEGSNHGDGNNPPCEPNLTLMRACVDQLGFIPFVASHDFDVGAPFHFPQFPACGNERPKSLMSYAPGKSNVNTFLEPLNHAAVLSTLDDFEFLFQGMGQGADATFTFRVKGDISLEKEVDVSLSYVEPHDRPWSIPAAGSPWRLVLRAANGGVLVDHPFAVTFRGAHGEPARERFGLRVPFEEDTSRAEIRYGDEVLWSRRVSENPPTASFANPQGGEFEAMDIVEVVWNASDGDGDALQFALDYSPDGETWEKLPQYLTGNTYDWRPGFVVASDHARLRLRVSDGFHTRTVISEPFAIRPSAPLAMIIGPKDEATFTEGTRIGLIGASMTSEGMDAGDFKWFVDGRRLGEGRETIHTLEEVGTHTVRLDVGTGAGADRLTGNDEVTIRVVGDYDRDGMPNDWEGLYRLNPLDLDDAQVDSDRDKLTNITEYKLGTNPRDPDTDDDGTEDGDEILGGGDPTNGGSLPPDGPMLRVGAESIGFKATANGGPSDAKTFWVTNSGIGEFTWTATGGASWLELSPRSGEAPTEVTMAVDPIELEPGEYTAQVVFSADAADSPQVVDVRLVVDPAGIETPRFLRGDCNDDGTVDISDATCTLNWLFLGGPAPGCLPVADMNTRDAINITDATYLLNFLFLGGPPLPPPYPDCGTSDLESDQTLGCLTPPEGCR